MCWSERAPGRATTAASVRRAPSGASRRDPVTARFTTGRAGRGSPRGVVGTRGRSGRDHPRVNPGITHPGEPRGGRRSGRVEECPGVGLGRPRRRAAAPREHGSALLDSASGSDPRFELEQLGDGPICERGPHAITVHPQRPEGTRPVLISEQDLYVRHAKRSRHSETSPRRMAPGRGRTHPARDRGGTPQLPGRHTQPSLVARPVPGYLH
jgi:hypothetical protein